MSKSVGSDRASSWAGNIYTVDGVRMEYKDLPQARKDIIKAQYKEVAKEMWEKLQGKTVELEVDGETISVGFNKKGVEHVARDAMMTLSGKYFSQRSMMSIDKILAKSEYIPTSHTDDGHNPHHAKSLWFKFRDRTGRGVYFKVNHNTENGQYTLYSVGDK